MKVAFDYQIFTSQTYGGISRYYAILADELVKQKQDVNIYAGMHRNHYLSELPDGVVNGSRISRYPPKTNRVFHYLNHSFSQLKVKSWQPDIIHETYYSSLPTFKTDAVRVATVHDMIHELFANQFSSLDKTTEWKKSTFDRVDHIISISQNTKNDLINFFGIDEKKISVIYHGIDVAAFQKIPKILTGFDKPFILYVGSREGYKNFNGFLKAFSMSSRLMNELEIVAFGGGVFSAEEQNMIKQLGFSSGQVCQMGGSDETLVALYYQAVAFVYPSLYEGFGLPPLEAMAAGCPVISSNTSSMPEVIGNAGEYFDPYNIDDMQNAVEKVVFSSSAQKDLIKLGYKNINNFSWMKCANETLGVYKKLTGKE